MKFTTKMINMATKFGGKAFLKLKKISPELALGAGIVCGVGSVVAACIATRKLDGELKQTHAELDVVEKALDEAESSAEIKECKQNTLKIYANTGLRIAKIYTPAALLGLGSIGLILTSHGILKNRYLSTAAAYKALDEAYKSYRKHVAETLGYGDGEKAIAARAKAENNIRVMDESGEEAIKNGSSLVMDTPKSPYEFDFNRFTSTMWESDVSMVDAMLRREQNYANDILRLRGYLFLNEVLERIGINPTSMGQNLGWALGRGDDYVDFGYLEGFIRDYNTDADLCRKNIRLNFNCDGDIVAEIDKFERNRGARK